MTEDKELYSKRIEEEHHSTLDGKINEKVQEQMDLKPGEKKEAKDKK